MVDVCYVTSLPDRGTTLIFAIAIRPTTILDRTPPEAQLLSYLHNKHLLIILDGFEHHLGSVTC